MNRDRIFQSWIGAIRLRTLPLALSSILMGSFMAAADDSFDSWIFVLAALCTIFLQILSNLANDYGDSIHGADHVEREGPKRAVQMGLIKPSEMRTGILITALLAFLSGIALLIHSFSALSGMAAVFLFLGIGAIFAALGYTMGKKPYGYAGLGDLFVLIFFGFLGVLGSYFLYTKDLQGQHVLPAITAGFFATAVLNLNNIRDIDSDRKAGKRSIPVRIGRERAMYYQMFLLSAGTLSAIVYMILHYTQVYQFAFLLVIPLFYRNIKDIKNITRSEFLDPGLKRLSLGILLFTVLFGIGLVIR
ncbi:MAG: 1,4-dihydroxy-2-naphthoate polyprenyltransferase [Cyclobacteriaceae bacterium]|nr:1,4-dihydroxy-2-naphthoate polyprenyltransferase [Cyclobacteriaceae bacterium]